MSKNKYLQISKLKIIFWKFIHHYTHIIYEIELYFHLHVEIEFYFYLQMNISLYFSFFYIDLNGIGNCCKKNQKSEISVLKKWDKIGGNLWKAFKKKKIPLYNVCDAGFE